MALKKLQYQSTTRWKTYDPAAPPPPDGFGGALGITITQPPPVTNPLTVQGTISNCCANPIVTIWLTDNGGDNTYAPVAVMVTPPPNPQTMFNTTFPTMPPGDYTLTVQVQCGSETVSTSMNVTL